MSEKKHTSTALAWTFGTKLTLQGLINQHKKAASNTRETLGDKTQLAALNLANCEAEEFFSNDDDSFEPLEDQDFEAIQFGTLERGALSVSSDDESSHPRAPDTKESADVTAIDDDGDDSAFNPLLIPGETDADRTPNQTDTTSMDDAKSALVETFAQDKPHQEEDNLWFKLGGSLAVVGAVVGGVALAAAQNNGGRDGEATNRRQSNNKRRDDNK